jgi:hypothetical protein
MFRQRLTGHNFVKNLPVTADALDELSFLLDFLQRKDITTSGRDKPARQREEPLVRWSTFLCPDVFEDHADNESGVLKFVPIKQMGKVQPTTLRKYFKPRQ